MNFIHQCLSLAAALRDPATRRLNVRLFGSTLILVLLAGCAEPVLVHTRQELIQHLGQKVAVEGLAILKVMRKSPIAGLLGSVPM